MIDTLKSIAFICAGLVLLLTPFTTDVLPYMAVVYMALGSFLVGFEGVDLYLRCRKG